jgi:sporulation protein YlmC with PRC-barrel domain
LGAPDEEVSNTFLAEKLPGLPPHQRLNPAKEEEMMLKKVVALLACLALVALAGTAVAQQKAPAEKPAPAPAKKSQAPQPQKAAPPQAKAPAPPIAGVQPVAVGITVNELAVVTKGWSVKKQILKKPVYNDKNQKIGRVDDLIVAPDKAISYAIIGAGGFLGIDRHNVAIPVNQFKMKGGKIILPGATKAALKAMPKFQYAK